MHSIEQFYNHSQEESSTKWLIMLNTSIITRTPINSHRFENDNELILSLKCVRVSRLRGPVTCRCYLIIRET